MKKKPSNPAPRRRLLVLGRAERERAEFRPPGLGLGVVVSVVVAACSLLWVLPGMVMSSRPSCSPRGQAAKIMLVCWPVAKREVVRCDQNLR